MSYYNLTPDNVLNYRDARDAAHTQVRNLMRRVNNKVDAHISAEMIQAELEGREVALDLSPDGLRRLILTATVKEFGGGEVAAIDSPH